MTARFALLLALVLPLASFTATAANPAPATAPLVEGQDYAVIADGKPFAPLAGKIEVAEIFMYSCHHCANFEPKLQAWKARQAKDVRFTPVPLVYEDDDAFAQAFYAAQALGVLGKTHGATFEAVHGSHDLPHNPTIGELGTFYATLGIDEAKFKATVASPAVAASLRQARDFALGSGMEGTPAVVVNGRYLVHAHTLDDQLRIIDQLIARERGARRR
jgi:thiol:disulfide interchange protein DsbA